MLEWYVYVSDFNSRTFKEYNVFNHWRFMEDLKKIARKYRDRERDQFENEMAGWLKYYYWSKAEWEIILEHWPQLGEKYQEKIDVWDQIHMNWPQFCDYVWAHRAELRRKEKKDAD